MMKRPQKLYISCGGGLGDLIRSYLKDNVDWGYLKPIKETWPNTRIRAIITCHNTAARDFLEYNPYIDEVLAFPYQIDGSPIINKHSQGYVHIGKAGMKQAVKHQMPEVYIHPGDEPIYKEIVDRGNYIVINPFGGVPAKKCLPIEEWVLLVDKLIDVLGYNIIATGGSHHRICFKNDGGRTRVGTDEVREPMEEIFEYEREGLTNLVGRHVALATKLAMKANGFIGNYSGPLIAPWVAGVKTACFIASLPHLEIDSRTNRIAAWPITDHLPFSQPLYMSELNNDYKKARGLTVNFFRRP